MLGLAVVTAMAAMAFVGASTASANPETIVLCEAAELECGKPFAKKTTITSHATNPKLYSTVGIVECKESLSEVELLNELSALGVAHVKALTFAGECHLEKTACTVTTVSKGDLSFTKSGALSANVLAIKNAKEEETATNVKCGFLVNCTYSGSPKLTISSTAGGETVLVAAKAKLERSSGFCPATSEWEAKYVSLGAQWIES